MDGKGPTDPTYGNIGGDDDDDNHHDLMALLVSIVSTELFAWTILVDRRWLSDI